MLGPQVVFLRSRVWVGWGGGSVPSPGCSAAQTELGLRPRLPPRPGWEPPDPLSGSLCLLTEDEQREKSVSHQTVQQLVLEKEQALSDLNSVEKSLADLFRRYEKMKEVLEGFRKVCSCQGRAGRWMGVQRSGSKLGEVTGTRTWRPRVQQASGSSRGSQHLGCFFCGHILCPLSCQNEEVLKKCAQEYLSRVKKEEQRYQALKVHAEEKLDR